MSIRFTHPYDLVHKIATIVGSIVLVAISADLIDPVSDFLERVLRRNDLEWLWTILVLGFAIGGFVGAVVLLSRTLLPYWLPTYLYVRSVLLTKISPNEAERLGFLFDGSLGGRWYPLGSIRKIDVDYRKEFLFRFANKIASEQGWHSPFAMPEDKINQQKQNSREGENMRGQETSGSGDKQMEFCLETLGLHQQPTTFEPIKQAYRRKIKEFHPDKFIGEPPEVLRYADETSKKLNAAYAYLKRRYSEGIV